MSAPESYVSSVVSTGTLHIIVAMKNNAGNDQCLVQIIGFKPAGYMTSTVNAAPQNK